MKEYRELGAHTLALRSSRGAPTEEANHVTASTAAGVGNTSSTHVHLRPHATSLVDALAMTYHMDVYKCPDG